MPFDWKEFLAVAKFLQGQAGDNFSEEAASRCAVSRAYYAAYCHARNYAREKQGFIPSKTAEDHINVRRHYQHQGDGRMRKIASVLDALYQWRTTCDYEDEIDSGVLGKQLKLAILNSERLAADLQ